MSAANQAKLHNALHNEGGYGFNPFADQDEQNAAAAVEARIQHIISNIDQYRSAWAAAVAKYSKGGKVNMLDMPKIEAEAGVTQNEIQIVKSRMSK